MIILKEKSDKDLQAHNAEMKELIRIIEHDRKLREFMACKGRPVSDDPKQVEWRHKNGKKTNTILFYVDTNKNIQEHLSFS